MDVFLQRHMDVLVRGPENSPGRKTLRPTLTTELIERHSQRRNLRSNSSSATVGRPSVRSQTTVHKQSLWAGRLDTRERIAHLLRQGSVFAQRLHDDGIAVTK